MFKRLTEEDKEFLATLIDEKINAAVQHIKNWQAGQEFEAVIGNIVLKAVNQALTREIRFEDSKENRGRVVEKSETWNILDWLVKYFPYMEGALRGCQSDAAQARNRAGETKQAVGAYIANVEALRKAIEQSQVVFLPEVENGMKRIAATPDVPGSVGGAEGSCGEFLF